MYVQDKDKRKICEGEERKGVLKDIQRGKVKMEGKKQQISVLRVMWRGEGKGNSLDEHERGKKKKERSC